MQSVHENINSAVCDICGKGFSCNKYLRRHKARHFKKEQCTVCRLRVETTLKEHYEEYHSDLPSVCQICYKRFQSDCYLKKHIMWSHTTKKDYTCDLCGFQYVDKETMKRHIKAHINGTVMLRGRTKVVKLPYMNYEGESHYLPSD